MKLNCYRSREYLVSVIGNQLWCDQKGAEGGRGERGRRFSSPRPSEGLNGHVGELGADLRKRVRIFRRCLWDDKDDRELEADQVYYCSRLSVQIQQNSASVGMNLLDGQLLLIHTCWTEALLTIIGATAVASPAATNVLLATPSSRTLRSSGNIPQVRRISLRWVVQWKPMSVQWDAVRIHFKYSSPPADPCPTVVGTVHRLVCVWDWVSGGDAQGELDSPSAWPVSSGQFGGVRFLVPRGASSGLVCARHRHPVLPSSVVVPCRWEPSIPPIEHVVYPAPMFRYDVPVSVDQRVPPSLSWKGSSRM